MADATIELSTIIVSYNTRALTLRCIQTLCDDTPIDASHEVFVVDNASADGSADAVEQRFPDVRVVRSVTNVGFGPANNQAIAAARGRQILLLNSDAFVHANAISRMSACLDAHPDVGVVGPKLLNADGTLQPSVWPFPSPCRRWIEAIGLSRLFATSWSLRDWRRWSHDVAANVPWAIGACLMIRRDAIDAVGGFDESFFLYGEETDLQRRIADAGWRVRFLPAAIATHIAGGSGGAQSARVFTEFNRGGERFVRKHHGRLGLLSARAATLVGSTIRVAAFGIASAARRGDAHLAERRRLWTRVWLWNVGLRGPGLND